MRHVAKPSFLQVTAATAQPSPPPPPSSTPSPGGAGVVDVGQAAKQTSSSFFVKYVVMRTLDKVDATMRELKEESKQDKKELKQELKHLETKGLQELKHLETKVSQELKHLETKVSQELKHLETKVSLELKVVKQELKTGQVIQAVMLGLISVEIFVPGGAKELASALFAAAALK